MLERASASSPSSLENSCAPWSEKYYSCLLRLQTARQNGGTSANWTRARQAWTVPSRPHQPVCPAGP